MPNPKCTGQGELDLGVLECGQVGRRVVEAPFDGGSMTSDAGVLLLSRVVQRVGLLAAAARCMPDPRNPVLITHAVHEMLRQRVYGLALGWEDLNDPLVAQRCRQCKRPWESTVRALFCGQQLLCALLRPSRIEAAKHAAAVLKLSCW